MTGVPVPSQLLPSCATLDSSLNFAEIYPPGSCEDWMRSVNGPRKVPGTRSVLILH